MTTSVYFRGNVTITVMLAWILVAAQAHGEDTWQPPKPVFTKEEVAAYRPKGPSRCFRHICLEYNNVTRDKNRKKNHESLFSEYDAAEYAQFCEDVNLDAALMLAVPQGGYTAYLQTKVGEPYPYLKKAQPRLLRRGNPRVA